MGNVATTIQTITTSIKNDMSANCQNTSTTEQTIDGVYFDISGADCGDINIHNSAVVNQTCDMDQVAGALAQATVGATQDQLLGLGLGANVGTTIQDRKNEILNKLQAQCGSEAQIKQTLKNLRFKIQPYCYPSGGLFNKTECIPARCGDISIVNGSNSSQQCVQTVVSKAIDEMQQNASTTQKNDLLSTLLGPLLLPLIGVGVILVIIIIFAAIKAAKSSGSGGTGGQTGLQALQAAQQAKQGIQGAQGAAAQAKGLFSMVKGFTGKPRSGSFLQNRAAVANKLGATAMRGGAKIGAHLQKVPLIVLIIFALVLISSRLSQKEKSDQK